MNDYFSLKLLHMLNLLHEEQPSLGYVSPRQFYVQKYQIAVA